MSLFNQIITALNNPEREANPNQLSNIVNTVQQLSTQAKTNPAVIQSAISIVGNYTRNSLQEKKNQQGEQSVNNLVNQLAGNTPNNQVLQMLFTNPQIQQLTTEIEQKTGLNQGTVKSMLPMLVPVVLNLLKTGNNVQKPNSENSVLHSFLDTNGDGKIDVADALKLVGNYLK
jgi:hypothetical protein